MSRGCGCGKLKVPPTHRVPTGAICCHEVQVSHWRRRQGSRCLPARATPGLTWILIEGVIETVVSAGNLTSQHCEVLVLGRSVYHNKETTPAAVKLMPMCKKPC